MNKPYFFNIRVLDARGRLQFAVHEMNTVAYHPRNVIMKHISDHGYQPVQTREAWLQTLTASPMKLTF